MELQMKEMSDRLMNANSALMDSAMKIGAQAIRTHSQVVRHQMTLVEKCFEAGNKHLELVREVRNPAEYLAQVGEINTDLGQEVAAIVREAVELQVEIGGSLMSTIREEMSKGFEV